MVRVPPVSSLVGGEVVSSLVGGEVSRADLSTTTTSVSSSDLYRPQPSADDQVPNQERLNSRDHPREGGSKVL